MNPDQLSDLLKARGDKLDWFDKSIPAHIKRL